MTAAQKLSILREALREIARLSDNAATKLIATEAVKASLK